MRIKCGSIFQRQNVSLQRDRKKTSVLATADGRIVKAYWCRLEAILRKSVEQFSRVRRLNDSNATRVCWRGNDVNSAFQCPRRTIEKALGEAPLYSGRNVLTGDLNMRTSLHTQLRGRFVEMLAIFQVHLTGKMYAVRYFKLIAMAAWRRWTVSTAEMLSSQCLLMCFITH